MSIIDPNAAYVVEKEGTYVSEDGTVSTYLAAGETISQGMAVQLGLVKGELPGADNSAADTEHNQERMRNAAPENRAKK
jgi:hypothetical protein